MSVLSALAGGAGRCAIAGLAAGSGHELAADFQHVGESCLPGRFSEAVFSAVSWVARIRPVVTIPHA